MSHHNLWSQILLYRQTCVIQADPEGECRMAAFNQLHNTNASMASNDVMHTSVELACSEPFPKHSTGIRQTPHTPQADEADMV